MKTSHILLIIIALVTLTGMVATDVLLKQEYQKIDWKNPYQSFVHQPLSAAKHWVVEGTVEREILLVRSVEKAEALIEPEHVKFFKTRQQGDTMFINFISDAKWASFAPRDYASDINRSKELVLKVADVQSLRVKNARLMLSELAADTLSITLQNSLFKTDKLAVSQGLTLTSRQNSLAVLGTEDQYNLLRAVVEDSSGVRLNNAQIKKFLYNVSPKAEIQLCGQALKWLK